MVDRELIRHDRFGWLKKKRVSGANLPVNDDSVKTRGVLELLELADNVQDS